MSEHVQPLATTARCVATHLPILTTSSESAAPLLATGAVRFVPMGHHRKLAPVERLPTGSRPHPRAQRAFVPTTDVAIAVACSDACPFRSGGCFAKAGFTRFKARELDAAARSLTADQVIAEGVRLVDAAFNNRRVTEDGARGGRDLRLHAGGDVGSALAAQLLAGAARRWRDRGGSAVWSFTHAWREVPREAWGSVSVLASVEQPEGVEVAPAGGYAATIVVDELPSDEAFSLPESNAKIVSCPAEGRGKTCVECRLCLDADKLARRNLAVAFEAHGPTARPVREALVQQRVLVVERPGADQSRGR
ncbi:DUF7227 family protein [Sorangium sp. So ce128]|uniref:DUF7227 family protein n=1 Tax=Sorangium sp. So ce128 TaxID=3133281 RepID=UPI003F63F20D